VTVTAERVAGVEPAQVVVRVRDDGAAIDAQLLPRVFETSANRMSGQASRGSNSDLALVQQVVKLHGGGIEVASAAPGRGVEFTVHLPILEVVSSAPTVEKQPVASGEARRRILIVDDNLDSVQGMATLQKRRGHEVRTAATGPEALEVAAEFHPDVVLLDIGLPGMDGFEVAKQLRASPEFERAFLIAMTGFATPEDKRHAKEVGFDEHLIKPVDLNRLRTWLADEARFSGAATTPR
jgi:CheY-like chemotaxis protein